MRRCAGEPLTCAALLALQLVLRLERHTQTVKVKHPTTLTFAGHQVLTGLLAHLEEGTDGEEKSKAALLLQLVASIQMKDSEMRPSRTYLAHKLLLPLALLCAVQAVARRIGTSFAPGTLQPTRELSDTTTDHQGEIKCFYRRFLDKLNILRIPDFHRRYLKSLKCEMSVSVSVLRSILVTSGSGHGDDRLFLALEVTAWFSPSCFRFLLRFGFSASLSSAESRNMFHKSRFSNSNVEDSERRLRRWFTSEELGTVFHSLLGFSHIFVSFLPPLLLFTSSF